ncbi:prominin-1-like isoform X5 [Dermacentor albipictus]|uniref:prominin-1-like isoform X5 n=1 Tax=Dermacentor albipictus TaxID=60249 RepID=UPI0031FD4BEB
MLEQDDALSQQLLARRRRRRRRRNASALVIRTGAMSAWNSAAKTLVHAIAVRPSPNFYKDLQTTFQQKSTMAYVTLLRSHQPAVYALCLLLSVFALAAVVSGVVFVVLRMYNRCGARRQVDVTDEYRQRYGTLVKMQLVCIGGLGTWLLALYLCNGGIRAGLTDMDAADQSMQVDTYAFFKHMQQAFGEIFNTTYPVLNAIASDVGDSDLMASKVLARYKNKENASSSALFSPVDNAINSYNKMVTALNAEGSSKELPKKVERFLRQPVEGMKEELNSAEISAKEALMQDKATPRIDVQRSLTDTADRIKASHDQYELDFQQALQMASTAHMLNHDKSIVNPQSLRIYRAAFLMVSVVSVAIIVAGLIFGFILGVSNYRSYVRPTQRNTACNMGGIVLISNAGLMWATCAFIPLLLTFCFPLAALLEAYVCQPYDERDGSSMDGAARHLFNIPKGKMFRQFTPSNILGKCNEETAYASISNLSLSPLEQLNAQRFRAQLFEAAGTQHLQEYVKHSTLNTINQYAKSIMDNLQQDNLAKQLMLSTASKEFDIFLESVKTVNASTTKLLASKDPTTNVDVAIAQLRTSVGDCAAARRVASMGFLVACRIVSDNMNGLWLSLVCCLLSMLAAIPVTLMISRYFVRMQRYLVDGKPPDEEVRGEQEARMKQEKHLKRIKEVREHILQQSRDARCLVMSFDTLEAPPTLPPVSPDSGCPDLARIIPTAVVRRVGIDDPKLPRGKQSPFCRVVALKPAAPGAEVHPLKSALQTDGFDVDDVSTAAGEFYSAMQGSEPVEVKTSGENANAKSVDIKKI